MSGRYDDRRGTHLSRLNQRHVASYDDVRAVGRANFERIVHQVDQNGLPTDAVLHGLLPHTDSLTHRKSGVWVHLAPAIQGDVRNWFEGAGWTAPEDWPKIAESILRFVRNCTERPATLESEARDFFNLPYSTGFQTGMLTPILNALRPDSFMLINNKSRPVINYFAGKSFKQRLTDYPAVNSAGFSLVDELQGDIRELSGLDASPTDLFDAFCHWLRAKRQYAPIFPDTRGVRLPGGEITVTVPEDDEGPSSTQGVTADRQFRESYEVQASLAEIGAKMGFQIWIPRNDRSNVLECSTELDSALLDELPLNYIDVTLRTIEHIDVIWIRKHSIARAFEVEHTTAIYSGLLRMADLLALQPDINIRLHIVAPDEKREKVMREIKRPIFSSLEKVPLFKRCSFIPYSSVRELRSLRRLEYMNDSVLKEYEEFPEEE